MRIKTIILAIFVCFILTIFVPGTLAESNTQSFYLTENASFFVENTNEEKSMVIPSDPLNFTSEVQWRIDFDKKITFSTKTKPYAKIFIILPNGENQEQTTVTYSQDQSGTLTLKPGQQCRIKINAGLFQNLFYKFGAKVVTECTYQKLYVTAEETSVIGGFQLSVYGPQKAVNWLWQLPDKSQISGASIKTVLSPSGQATITLINTEAVIKPYSFRLRVPPALETDPKIPATSGYEEFNITCNAGITSHYQSTSTCIWDFGDSTTPLAGTTVNHTYQHFGNYLLRLMIKNSHGIMTDKSWEITVRPFQIINQISITGDKGSIPLRITYNSDSKVNGSPSHLTYLWDFGDGTFSQSRSGEHIYPRIGEYTVSLKVTDEYHPYYDLTPSTKKVLAAPPVLGLNARAYPESGQTPLKVDFYPNLEIDGATSDLEFNWNFGDGSTSAERSPSHIYRQPGIYKVKLTVKDRTYFTTTSDAVIVNALLPEITSKSTLRPLSGSGPLIITGQASLSIDLGAELKYSWYLNDKLISGERLLRYTLSQPGVYNVTLQITADFPGQRVKTTHSWQVTVTAPVATPATTPLLPSGSDRKDGDSAGKGNVSN